MSRYEVYYRGFRVLLAKYNRFSIRFTLLGLSGLIHLQARTATYLRHRQRHFLRLLLLKHQV